MTRTRIQVVGPLAPYAPGFQAELRRLGYTASPAKKHFYLLAQTTPAGDGGLSLPGQPDITSDCLSERKTGFSITYTRNAPGAAT